MLDNNVDANVNQKKWNEEYKVSGSKTSLQGYFLLPQLIYMRLELKLQVECLSGVVRSVGLLLAGTPPHVQILLHTGRRSLVGDVCLHFRRKRCIKLFPREFVLLYHEL